MLFKLVTSFFIIIFFFLCSFLQAETGEGVSPIGTLSSLTAAELSVTPKVIELGNNTGGSSFESYFVVKNEGGESLSGNIVESAEWITSLNPSSISLDYNQTDTIRVLGSFPVEIGIFSEKILITSNGGSDTVIVSGQTILEGNLVISPTEINLGIHSPGSLFESMFIIKNETQETVNGSVSETVDWITSLSPPSFNLANTETDTIRFSGLFPTEIGDFGNSILVSSSIGDSYVFVSGATYSGLLVVTPTVINVGSNVAGTSFESLFVVKNEGIGTLSGSVSETVDWITTINKLSFNLANNETDTISFSGIFPSEHGGFSGDFVINSSGGNDTLTVSGINTSIFEIDPASVFINHLNGQVRSLYGQPVNSEARQDALKMMGSKLSMETWIYPFLLPDLANEISIIEYTSDTSLLSSYRLFISNRVGENGPKLNFSIRTGDGAQVDTGMVTNIVSENIIALEKWVHLAASFDGSMLRIYIDGTLDTEGPNNGVSNEILEQEGNFYIGYRARPLYPDEPDSSRYYYGLVDDIRLWNVARTQLEITTNMNNQLMDIESGLVGYWSLDQNNDGKTPDLTFNQNDLRARTIFTKNWLPGMIGTNAHINLTNQNIDLGSLERKKWVFIDSISINNSGDKPLFGFLKSENTMYDIPINSIFVEPNTTRKYSSYILPLQKGNISGNLYFEQNNADNSEIQIALTGTIVREEGIDANNIDMWVSHNNEFIFTPILEWPKNSLKHVVFSTGMWLGAEVEGQVHTSVASYLSDFAPGPIIDGLAANATDPKYHVYKIELGDNASNPDYATWPADMGAPIEHDGSPKHLGNQTLFTVYNDINASYRNNLQNNQGSYPLGAEIQQTVFAFDDEGALNNTVFLRFKIINKSDKTWQNTYLGLWSDPDVGGATDDFVGVDTLRNLAFAYNSSENDNIYSERPPAVGYDFLRGAFYTKPTQAFAYYSGDGGSYPIRDPENYQQVYNYLQGLVQDGTSYFDPVTSIPTSFPLNGDPISSSGWYDSSPADRRFMLSTGPFNLEPGQAKEIIAAIIIAQGKDYLNSITELQTASDSIQTLFDQGVLFGGAIENVTVGVLTANETDTLNDIANSGTEVGVTAAEEGATVEIATYIDTPPGSENVQESAIHGVGNYMDIQVQGNIVWPLSLKVYYTQNNLEEAGITEDDLAGIYYWSAARNEWTLYSNSGEDDQGRGPSITVVNIDNLEINGITYEGFVSANAYHLTPIRIGSKIDSSLIKKPEELPKNFYLAQNYPNPFNPSTVISYKLPKPSDVEIVIYNIAGQKIVTLFSGKKEAGVHELIFNTYGLSTGIYFYKITAGKYAKIKKMVLLK